MFGCNPHVLKLSDTDSLFIWSESAYLLLLQCHGRGVSSPKGDGLRISKIDKRGGFSYPSAFLVERVPPTIVLNLMDHMQC